MTPSEIKKLLDRWVDLSSRIDEAMRSMDENTNVLYAVRRDLFLDDVEELMNRINLGGEHR